MSWRAVAVVKAEFFSCETTKTDPHQLGLKPFLLQPPWAVVIILLPFLLSNVAEM